MNILTKKKGERAFLLGNEAIVRGAVESGVNIVTFYPGTPSSEIGVMFSKIFRKSKMTWVESSINEKVAVEIAGATYARGGVVLTSMKNVGLNVASDALFAISTSKPRNPDSSMVIVVADDPEAHSSAVEMDSRSYLHLLKIPALEPSNPQECLAFTKRAFEISKELKLPVILRTVTMVSHARSNVEFGEFKPPNRLGNFDLSKEVNVASRMYFLDLKEDQIYNRMNQALKLSEESSLNKIIFANKSSSQLGIIVSGVAFHYVQEALSFLDISIPILKLGFIHPFPVKKVLEFLKRFDEVLVVEEMDAFIEMQVLAVANGTQLRTKIYGKSPFHYSKKGSYLSLVGELNPTKLVIALIQLLRTHLELKVDLEELKRKKIVTFKRLPIMCPGCPHRTTGHALKEVIKKIKSSKGLNAYFYQDIGCYTMLSYPPLGFANVKYCMGSSIAAAQGVARTSDDLHIALIGDGTFFHAGIPALINAIHYKAPILVLILDNGWIGMTGQQPHPGSPTMHYKDGEFNKQIDLEALLRGIGANVTLINHSSDNTPYFKTLENEILLKSLKVIKNRDLQVILIRDECIQKSIKRKPVIKRNINSELCTDCGECYSQFSCPSINYWKDQVLIDASSCLGCGICEEICLNKAIYGGEDIEKH